MYHALVVRDKRMSVTPSIKTQMLENIHEKVCEPKIMLKLRCGGLSEACKEILLKG